MRETQLLERAGNGMTDQAIAADLGISLATVATYWGRIRIKFGPLSRTEIVANQLRMAAAQEAATFEKEANVLRNQLKMMTEGGGIFEQVLSLAPYALILTKVLDGTIEFVNKKLTDLVGYSEAELVGRPVTDFIHIDFHADHLARRQEWADEETEAGHETSAALLVPTKSKGDIWVTADSSVFELGSQRMLASAIFPIE